ncbi:MAG TPA: hypothetical protein GX687_02450 [Clostridia bacterium]|jgi:hypothetical protein|nr:hypothetical protein [Clostridia bacterium]
MSGLFILLLIPLAIIVLIFLVAAFLKARSIKKNGEDGEMIKKVYVYLILFTTLMMVIGGSVAVFMAAADILTPTPYYQTFEDYKLRFEKEGDAEPQLSDAEIRIQYEAMVENEKERQIQRAKNSLIKSFGWIVIPLPIFIFYQRQLSKGF